VTLSQEDLFKIALNLQDPWYIKSIEFSNEEKQLDLHIDFTAGSRFEEHAQSIESPIRNRPENIFS
jgi:hypothetical protein